MTALKSNSRPSAGPKLYGEVKTVELIHRDTNQKVKFTSAEFRDYMKTLNASQEPKKAGRITTGPAKESESQLQAACVKWFRTVHHEFANDLRAIPNGGTTSVQVNPKTGKTYSLEGQRFKAEGLVPGTPDLFLSVPVLKREYCGLWIEMKVPGGTLSNAQINELMRLQRLGYAIAVCYSRKEFEAAVGAYLRSEAMPELLLIPLLKGKNDVQKLHNPAKKPRQKCK